MLPYKAGCKETKFEEKLYNDFLIRCLFKNEAIIDEIFNHNQLLEDYLSIVNIVNSGNQNEFNFPLVEAVSLKNVQISSMFDKKRKLVKELETKMQSLKERLEKEKRTYDQAMIFMKKEQDYKKKCQEGQKLFDLKGSQYYRNIKTLESNLASLGFNENLRDESIQGLYQENETLREKINEIKERLSNYDFKPNNKSLLSAINNIKEELDIVREEFIKELDNSRNELN